MMVDRSSENCAACGAAIPPTAQKCSACGTLAVAHLGQTAPDASTTDVSSAGQADRCPHCNGMVPPTAQRCPDCHRPIAARLGHTAPDEPDSGSTASESAARLPPAQAPPAAGELPPGIWKWNAGLVAVVLLLGVLANVATNLDNSLTQLEHWGDECARAFQSPRESGQQHWRSEAQTAPTEVQAVFIVSDPAEEQFAQQLLKKLGLESLRELLVKPEEWKPESSLAVRSSDRQADWLILQCARRPGLVALEVELFAYDNSGLPSFAYRAARGPFSLYLAFVLQFVAVLGLALACRGLVIAHYRKQRKLAYEAGEAARTASILRLRNQFVEARTLANAGEREQAMALLEKVLRVWPDYAEAAEFRASLLRGSAASIDPKPVSKSALGTSPQLYLRILGTPYAYSSAPNAERITVGRQRRKGGSEDEGNDFVVRAPSGDEQSLRISRRQFEVVRVRDEHYVIDRSTSGTLHNGSPLVKDQAVRIRSGDHLRVAGVVTLEVLIRTEPLFGMGQASLNVPQEAQAVAAEAGQPASAEGPRKLVVEASIGDMCTVE